MRIIALLGALAIGLPFTIRFLADKFGPGPGSRFLETGEPYDAAKLTDFVTHHATEAGRYAMPILVPLDMLYALSVGLFLALASKWCAEAVPLLRPWGLWFMVLPLIFLISDLSEDTSLARMLLSKDAITDKAVQITQILTATKIKVLMVALAQTALLGAWGAIVEFKST